jgi:hypothetical protein
VKSAHEDAFDVAVIFSEACQDAANLFHDGDWFQCQHPIGDPLCTGAVRGEFRFLLSGDERTEHDTVRVGSGFKRSGECETISVSVTIFAPFR